MDLSFLCFLATHLHFSVFPIPLLCCGAFAAPVGAFLFFSSNFGALTANILLFCLSPIPCLGLGVPIQHSRCNLVCGVGVHDLFAIIEKFRFGLVLPALGITGFAFAPVVLAAIAVFIRIAHAAHGNHEPRHVTGTLARITWFRRRSMSARKIRRQLIRLQCQHHLTFDLPRQYQIETLRKLLKRQGLHDLRIDAPLGV